MNKPHQQCSDLLNQLEHELKALDWWQSEPLPISAYSSTQPFSIDTMDFAQWLQFVFLMRMRALCDAEAALPSECGIAPMIEEFAATRGDNVTALKIVLEQLDGLLSGGAKLP